MSVSPINSYKDFCSEFIPEQYKNSEKLLGLTESVLTQCDFIEKALHELLDSIDISKAEGPALDFIGSLVGVERIPGQVDSLYRDAIINRFTSEGLPSPEVLRKVLQLATNVEDIGLYPNWPAELYYVLYGETTADLSNLETENMTSGASLVRGTFLVGEMDDNGEYECGYIVNEDNGQPLVVDYYYPTTLYEVVDEEDVDILIKDSATEETTEPLLALDY